MALTAMEVNRFTCPDGQKQIKKSDGNGLFLLVKNNGSKLWRLRYRFNSKYQELALGKYPTIPLIEARRLATEARTLLVQGINPTDERRAKKRSETALPILISLFCLTQNVLISFTKKQNPLRPVLFFYALHIN